jgi:hypothetical protein
MRWVDLLVRIVCSGLLVATLVTRLLGVETPWTQPEAIAFHEAMLAAGFPYVLLSIGEALVAVGLLIPRTAAAAALALLPIAGSIACFHLFLEPAPIGFFSATMLTFGALLTLWNRRERVLALVAPTG